MPKPKNTKAKSSSSRAPARRAAARATKAAKATKKVALRKAPAKKASAQKASAKKVTVRGASAKGATKPSRAPAAQKKASAKPSTKARASARTAAKVKAAAKVVKAPRQTSSKSKVLEPVVKAAPALRKAPPVARKPLLIGDVVKASPSRSTLARALPEGVKVEASTVPTPLTIKPTKPRSAPGVRTLARIRDLAGRLGYSALHPELEGLIQAALAGKDALGIVQDGDDAALLALTVSPEISEPVWFVSPSGVALRCLESRALGLGVPSVRLATGASPAERARAISRVAQGGPLLVLLSAAELSSRDLAQASSRVGIGLVVVDEAHVASAFGHELRPSVADVAATSQRLGQPPLVALTRPVPPAARRDLIERLGLRDARVFELPLVREQVALETFVARGEARQARLAELLQQLQAPGLIFCAQPHDVDSVYATLVAMQLPAHRHHAGLAPADRARELEAWSAPERRAVLVATSGFLSPSGVLGLGEEEEPTLAPFGRFVSRRDVRFVIHYQAPSSLDQYVREIALAGRDGEGASAVLFYESAHRSLNDALLAQQRFRPQHLLDLSRALESAAAEGKPLTVEALALSIGQSRRTMERLTALLADAGLIEKTSKGVRPVATTNEIAETCQKLSARLEELRRDDARRLDAVTEYAEGNSCRLEALSNAFGQSHAPCGRCSVCSPRELERGSRDLSPGPLRRPAAQSFSAGPVPNATTGEASPRPLPLTAHAGEIQGH
jgi:ATP-dependent DNA helicase RecQ